jgi:hypothetical protein
MLRRYSLRAMTTMAIRCFQRYCEEHRLSDSSIDAFCDKMLELNTASNIVEWDASINELEINGYGDPLPLRLLEKFPDYSANLDSITQHIREITLSQMFGAPEYSIAKQQLYIVENLTKVKAMDILNLRHFSKHNGGRDLWGDEVSTEILSKW